MNEVNQYAQYLPPLLVVLGGALQWLRQFPKLHDAWIVLFAFLLANGGYWLCYDYTVHHGWQLVTITWLLAIAGHTATVLGGTAVAARASYSTGMIPKASTTN